MLRPGDWICAPKYGADGDVLEVTLTTVKVQNWRGMFDHSVRPCPGRTSYIRSEGIPGSGEY